MSYINYSFKSFNIFSYYYLGTLSRNYFIASLSIFMSSSFNYSSTGSGLFLFLIFIISSIISPSYLFSYFSSFSNFKGSRNFNDYISVNRSTSRFSAMNIDPKDITIGCRIVVTHP